jgi:para-nitrobenzyl esterase
MAELDEEHLLRATERGLRSAGLAGRISPGEVVGTYRSARAARGAPTGPFDLYAAMASDWVFRVPSLRLADAHAAAGGRTYCYLFQYETPFGEGKLGACHALELPFVFGTLVEPMVGTFCGDTPEARALSASMQDAWASFARTGDPAGEAGAGAGPGAVAAATIGPWPRYEPTTRPTMVFDLRCGVAEDPLGEERAFWAQHLGAYGAGGPVEGVPIGRPMLEAAGLWTDDGAVRSGAATGT